MSRISPIAELGGERGQPEGGVRGEAAQQRGGATPERPGPGTRRGSLVNTYGPDGGAASLAGRLRHRPCRTHSPPLEHCVTAVDGDRVRYPAARRAQGEGCSDGAEGVPRRHDDGQPRVRSSLGEGLAKANLEGDPGPVRAAERPQADVVAPAAQADAPLPVHEHPELRGAPTPGRIGEQAGHGGNEGPDIQHLGGIEPGGGAGEHVAPLIFGGVGQSQCRHRPVGRRRRARRRVEAAQLEVGPARDLQRGPEPAGGPQAGRGQDPARGPDPQQGPVRLQEGSVDPRALARGPSAASWSSRSRG